MQLERLNIELFPYHAIQLVSVIKLYIPQAHYPGNKYSVRWIEYDCNSIQSNTIKLNVFIRIQRFHLMTKQSIEFLFRLDWMKWEEWNGTGCICMCLEWGLNVNVLRWTIERNILASPCDKWNGKECRVWTETFDRRNEWIFMIMMPFV